ncbi:Vegetative incompatibility protein HET-E-1 [Lachnellula cervina]|uniref:Vegetative incompatibility protein HET-E-1 n=1 Tax=Lachnellula cervina TaxID=1316786 RepID=A0A7D8UKN9_9HELO|nr:Vegetative incompatibility protein HET-E-1 [Lachnellula cervina]
MRLLNVQSGEIEEFPGWLNPGYDILSHCWGDDERRKRGTRKIQYACEQARRDEWDFLSIDTCCIDKPPQQRRAFRSDKLHVQVVSGVSGLLSTTKIPENILKEPLELEYASLAKKMAWAAGRQTTRVEDVAYCLLGLFDVNMPLLYGKGTKAFIRLQEENLKSSDDQSLFAWNT